MAISTVTLNATIVFRKRPASGKKCIECRDRCYLEEIRPYFLLEGSRKLVGMPFRWCAACGEDLIKERRYGLG